MEEGCSLMILL